MDDLISRQAAKVDGVKELTERMNVLAENVGHALGVMSKQVDDLTQKVELLSEAEALQPTCNQLATDTISRQAAQTELMMKCERYTLARESHGMGHVEWSSDLISVADAMDAIRDLPSANGMTFEEIAQLLSDLFGECACDVNDNDEWLPQACKYAETECPKPKEKNGCWMQFLMQGGADMRGGDNEAD